ncbi:MAG: LamG domain-containing protein [Prolixibacteraceae bacterium]|nr:LamG domain-containing protein [Prolixibacteraceae bacterium]
MKMKNLFGVRILLLMLVVSSAMIFGSCEKDEPVGDKTSLTALISAADQLSASATVAVYPQAAIDAFKTALAAVKTASASTTLTQAEVDAQVTALNAATATLNTYKTDDYAALYALITSSETLANGATSATYPQTAIDNFKTTLATVKTAAATLLTPAQITNLNVNLTAAKKTFGTQIYGFIDEALYLTAGWHFDEGTGTTATAFSTVKHVGTFKAGNAVIMGANSKSPAWGDGLKGGKALVLDGGAHLEVPYTTAFLPANLTISVWVKPTVLRADNYIVSQNYWTGYKLQIQDGGKPFFTFKKVDGGIVDADNETDNSVKVNVWNHVVVTLNATTKELKFFVNGTHTKTWTEANKGIGPLTQTLTAPSPQPFIIGGVATDAELAANFMEWTTAANLGYFKGSIDELKIYNIALADGQISKLYMDEKP